MLGRNENRDNSPRAIAKDRNSSCTISLVASTFLRSCSRSSTPLSLWWPPLSCDLVHAVAPPLISAVVNQIYTRYQLVRKETFSRPPSCFCQSKAPRQQQQNERILSHNHYNPQLTKPPRNPPCQLTPYPNLRPLCPVYVQSHLGMTEDPSFHGLRHLLPEQISYR